MAIRVVWRYAHLLSGKYSLICEQNLLLSWFKERNKSGVSVRSYWSSGIHLCIFRRITLITRSKCFTSTRVKSRYKIQLMCIAATTCFQFERPVV